MEECEESFPYTSSMGDRSYNVMAGGLALEEVLMVDKRAPSWERGELKAGEEQSAGRRAEEQEGEGIILLAFIITMASPLIEMADAILADSNSLTKPNVIPALSLSESNCHLISNLTNLKLL